MFCDLVGSTPLSSRLEIDENAVAHVLGDEAIEPGDDLGDRAVISGGYPRAHEDDAERAVRAGLSSIDSVGRLDVKSAKLQARVGIATGWWSWAI
jgi:class 3 adenylate cyclase